MLDLAGREAIAMSIGKLLKMVIGVLLLPLCVGSAWTLWRMLPVFGSAHAIWLPLAAGAAAWMLVYTLFPRPMWLYVAGHELTHAASTWLFGGRVRKIRVTAEGGHVVMSKTNFVIALAPYFFPFYVAVVLLMFMVAHLVWPWSRLEVWFLASLGAAYAFHVTLTGHILKTRQSDITEHGYLFSASIIFLGNTLVLLVGLPLLTSNPTLRTTAAWCWESTLEVIRFIGTGMV
jgi:hypothetical protein